MSVNGWGSWTSVELTKLMVETKMKNFKMVDWINILESRRCGLVTGGSAESSQDVQLVGFCGVWHFYAGLLRLCGVQL